MLTDTDEYDLVQVIPIEGMFLYSNQEEVLPGTSSKSVDNTTLLEFFSL